MKNDHNHISVKKIRTSLLESCCFYDVGVRPLSLMGNSPLIITLRDHENLPKLNDEFSKAQKVLRKVALFISRNPDIHLSKNFIMTQALEQEELLHLMSN